MSDSPYISTTNACKLCAPLGAAFVFRGIEGCVPFLHGSQGCATYMRRYMISHFREPVDIASSSLGEHQAVFGGGPNLKKGLLNVMQKYDAEVVGVASTCLTETIGDDLPLLISEFKREFGDLPLAEVVDVSSASFAGTHMDGFNAAVKAVVERLAKDAEPHGGLNLLPGFVSPADIRHIREVCEDFGLTATILPDYSENLDGPAWSEYHRIPEGGTPLDAVRAMGGAAATIECGRCLAHAKSAGEDLKTRFGVENYRIGLPIGLRESDSFFAALEAVSGKASPKKHVIERGRLVDSFVDAHKYVSGRRVAVYGEEDLVVGLVSFLSEIGMKPVLAATGGEGKGFAREIEAVCSDVGREIPVIRKGADFHDIAEECAKLDPELLVGHSKGYKYAREWNIPLVRVGFPIHDRIGAQRVLSVGYAGAHALFDRVVNALLAKAQDDHSWGYGYL